MFNASSIEDAKAEMTDLMKNIANFKVDMKRKDLVEYALGVVQSNFKVMYFSEEQK